ncbi:HAD family hydrolase [Dyadobacter sp. Leaf189]|uniref:HAD family hydrolase n=1 Tax=Dyadobacter sp. Leaf189 TaxID=1736295 RepID=UPI0006F91351|nr:HAD family hydrolase [Dyadobacter sp. Leaf189]KQS34366.1 HAD family hydrolase [Dyadobacter sp. Leaf189]
MKNHIKVIAFDADDTLWVNEPFFQETEQQFCTMLEDFLPQHSISQELYKMQVKNLPLYGYGIKCFMLCMIETAYNVSGGTASMEIIRDIIALGQEMLNKPVELLEDVQHVLETLKGRYRLIVATKGDLLDQERKLQKSGLLEYFHHIEIMSDKRVQDYSKLIRHLDCRPENFLMLGNSIKSDVLPVLELGGFAAHIPFHVTWHHEHYEHTLEHANFMQLERLGEILDHL